MSTDTDNVIKAIERVNEVWARAIEVAVGIYLLARQLGWPCVVPLIAVLGKPALFIAGRDSTESLLQCPLALLVSYQRGSAAIRRNGSMPSRNGLPLRVRCCQASRASR